MEQDGPRLVHADAARLQRPAVRAREQRRVRRVRPRRPGDEVYRQRLPHVGSGFSASPVAADGKIYLSNEDGDIIVVAAGPEFKQIATNSMGELLMATPALSEGVMYVGRREPLRHWQEIARCAGRAFRRSFLEDGRFAPRWWRIQVTGVLQRVGGRTENVYLPGEVKV